jgi:hypothetical protein
MKKHLDMTCTEYEAATEPRELSDEIAQTERELIQLQTKIERMGDDPSTGMAMLVRATVREAELQAYLKGLRFTARLVTRHASAESNVYA